jgi:hypothetical protein
MTAELVAAEAPGVPDVGVTSGRAIAPLIDPLTYPALADGVFEDDRPATEQAGDDVGGSMNIILDGGAALIERRSAAAEGGMRRAD